MSLGKLIDIIKLPPQYLFGIALIAGFLLYAPEETLRNIGLLDFIERFQMWIGIVFLSSTAFFIVAVLVVVGKMIKGGFNKRKNARIRKERLRNLNPDEKEILRYYFEHNTRSLKLSIMNGVVRELESFRIIYLSSEMGGGRAGRTMFSYNIQPFAWDYLKKHPYLLEHKQEQEG